MSTKKPTNRSGFPGGADDDELNAEFDAWDESFGDLFAEPTGAGGKQGPPPGQAGARRPPAGQEFEFELSLDDARDAEPEAEVEMDEAPTTTVRVPPAGAQLDDDEDEPEIQITAQPEVEPAARSSTAAPAARPEVKPAARPEVKPAAGASTAAPAARAEARLAAEAATAAVDLDGAFEQPEALGQLLGTTSPIDIDDIDDGDSDTPLPPPFEQDSGMFAMPTAPVANVVDGFTGEDDGEEVLTSATRPLTDAASAATVRAPQSPQKSQPHTRPAAQPQAASQPKPQAQPPRGTRARPGSVMDAFQPAVEGDEDEEFDPFAGPEDGSSSQVTKVVKVDQSLLAAAAEPESTEPRQPKRRAPTIVRRDELERLRAERASHVTDVGQGDPDDEDDEDDDGFGGRDTQLLSSEQIESLAEETANTPAPVVVSVDADFYDDIVIGEADAAAPQSEVHNEVTPAVRRVSAHVVRRDTLQPLREAERSKPVLRPRSRRSRNSEQQLANQLESSRTLDPESTLDLRVALDGSAVEPAAAEGNRPSRAEEIQAIIDRAARSLRGPRSETAPPAPQSLPPVVLPPEEASAAEEAFEDFELDWEVEPETKPAAPGLVSKPAGAGPRAGGPDELAAIPGLPEPVLPTGDAAEWPALDVAALAIPEAAQPLGPEGMAARAQELDAALTRYERALRGNTRKEQAARLRLEAGRMSERLGRAALARAHYEGALGFDPHLQPALRGLRRIERAQGRWSDAVQALDREIAEVTTLEQRALRGHRIDLLMAHGERELAAVSVAELAGDAGMDARALLTQLELALADRRDADAARALARLAERMADRAPNSPNSEAQAGGVDRVGDTLARMRGILEERLEGGGDPGSAFAAAAAAGAPTALLAAAGVAQRAGNAALAGVAELARSMPGDALAGASPGFGAALAWRRALWTEAAQRAAGASADGPEATDVATDVATDAGVASAMGWEAQVEAAALAPDEAFLAAEAADMAAARGDHARAAELFQQLGAVAPSEAEQAAALARAARHLGALGRGAEAAELLARVQALDPSSPAPVLLLAPVLEQAGDVEALIALDRQAVASDPEGALHERVRAARRLAVVGRLDEAVAELEAGRGLTPDSAVLQQALVDVLSQADRTHARAGLLASLADDPDAGLGPDVLLWRAALAYEDHARSVVRDPGAEPAAESDAQAETAEAAEPRRALREGALASALEAWNRVLDRDPESTAAHLASVRLAELLGDSDVLEDALARAQAASADPGHAAAMGLWRVALATGQPATLPAEDPELLDEVLRELAAVQPADPRPALTRAILAASEGRFADAAAALDDRATALGDTLPATALRYRAAGLYLDGADEPATAAALFENVVRAAPGLAPAQELLRAARLRMGELTGPAYLDEPSGDAAGEPVRGAGDDAFARLVREADACLAHLGDPVRALELYDKALALREGDARAHALVRQGLTRAAIQAGAFDRLVETVEQERARAQARGQREGARPPGAENVAAAVAAAHEELARIEERLRLDPDAALEHARAALAADPGRASAWRMLELAHLRAQRWDELRAGYQALMDGLVAGQEAGREAGQTGSDREAAALALALAHLAERLARPQAEILDAYGRAHARDRSSQPALFHREAAARAALAANPEGNDDRAGLLVALGELEQAAAELFARDPLARAAFLTRAGESALERAALEEAVGLFRDADDVVRAQAEAEPAPDGEAAAPAGPPGYSAALFGWRTAALRGSLWLDVAEAAQREARLPEAAASRVASFHLAGVALMDRALDGEHAIQALTEVLTADPMHDDAFARMRVLLEEQGEHEHQVGLLTERLAHEDRAQSDVAVRAYLHRELARQQRNFIGDREAARSHWREVLALVPGEREAITALADLAWELGDWQEAAEQLTRRARIETDAGVRKHIFYRLGTIYAERLPEPELALKAFKQVLRFDANDTGALEGIVRLGTQTGDHQLALSASERLVRGSADAEAKVPHLHRMADIYQKGMRDVARAERAYRTALDLAPTSDEALSALVGFYEQRGDLRSTRVHLDRVAAAMRVRAVGSPGDGVAYRVIARAMKARQQAGVEGSLAPAACAAELSLLCEAGDERERALVAQASRGLAGLAGVNAPGADEYLFPAIVSQTLRQLLGQLGERLVRHVGADLRRYDVGRGQRLRDREALAVFEAVAGELGLPPAAVYVSDKHPHVLAIEPTEPISVVLGAALLADMKEPELRFIAGRAMTWARPQAALAVPARMTADEFAVFLVALLRQFDPMFVNDGVDSAAVEAEAQKLRRVISGSVVQDLRVLALGVMGQDFNPAALWAGIMEVGNRGGLLACGSIEAAIDVLRRSADMVDASLDAVLAEPGIAALVRFAISNEHAQLRATLGTSAG